MTPTRAGDPFTPREEPLRPECRAAVSPAENPQITVGEPAARPAQVIAVLESPTPITETLGWGDGEVSLPPNNRALPGGENH